jgi:integrase
LLGFPILFQCKRYRGSVGAGAIRDFRGAMIGRADRGVVITTGTFSRDARAEATRDGAPPIDLVDGEQLLDTRHSYATLALATGEHVKVVGEALGHADVATTLRTYAHVLPSQRVALADKMESLLLDEVQEKSG